MRLLLDECVDADFASQITGHLVSTVAAEGWKGVQNGALLRQASERFDVLVTVDKNLPHQQSLKGVDLAVVVFQVHPPRSQRLAELLPALYEALDDIQPGQVVVLIPGST